jgi:tetratricopeptide (TPR) repeat protein
MDSDEVALTQVLGVCALNMQNLAEAKALYEELAKLHGARENRFAEAAALQQLGTIATEQRDFAAAEAAYRKCLVIQKAQGDDSGVLGTCNQLAMVAGAQENWEDSGQWLIQSLTVLARTNDTEGVHRNTLSLLRAYKRTSGAGQAKLRALWQDAGLGEFPSESEIVTE